MIMGVFRGAALACAIALASVAAAAGPDSATPSATDFGALPAVTRPAISPDGKLIAAEGQVRGKSTVLIFGAAVQGRTIQPVPLPEGHRIEWIRWAGPRRVLVSLSTMTKLGGVDFRMTRVAVLDLDTNKQTFLGPREQGVDGDDVIHIDPDGRFVLVSAQPSLFQYPAVYRVDLATGRDAKIVEAQDHVWSWFADSAGVVRAGVAAYNGRSWVLYRDRDGAAFQRGKTHDLGVVDGVTIDELVIVPGSDQGYAVAAAAKTGRFGLYHYDFAKDALGTLIYEHPGVDIDTADISPEGQVRGVFFDDDKPGVTWFTPEMQALQGRLDRAVPNHLNRVVSASRDRKQLIVWSGSATDPGAYFVYDRTIGHMDAFADLYPGLAGKRLAVMEPVRYKARDGLELRAYLTMPPGGGDKNLPMVVMPHGGPFARDSWGYEPWAQFLASKGYVVLQPNFRGSTGFGAAFVEKGVGQWGRGMQDDIDDGVKWLVAQGKVDPKRVCIMGASFGGYAAMWAAVRNPEIYRCAISFAGVSDVAAILRYDSSLTAAPRYFRDWRARIKGDRDFELDQISPLKQVDRMTVPILIAHGADDQRVPLSQSRKLHEALSKLNRAHEYVVYPGEGHGFTDPAHATDFLNRVGKFLDQHNPAGS